MPGILDGIRIIDMTQFISGSRCTQLLADMGANVIGITDTPASPIAKLAQTALCAHSDMVSFVDTLVAPLSLVNALVVATSARAKDDLLNNFEKLESIWDEYEVYEKADI